MDVKTIELVLLGSILIQASIVGVAADKISEKDREVPKLANKGNNLEETAAVRALSLEKMILQESLLKKDVKENRKKRAGNAQKRQEGETCIYQKCDKDSDCCAEYPVCTWSGALGSRFICWEEYKPCYARPCSDDSDCCNSFPKCQWFRKRDFLKCGHWDTGGDPL